jgi:hypothetical protein
VICDDDLDEAIDIFGVGGISIIAISRHDVELASSDRECCVMKKIINALVVGNFITNESNKIGLSFNGYDDDARELYEIKEVRDFVRKLLIAVPLLPFICIDDTLDLVACCSFDVKIIEKGVIGEPAFVTFGDTRGEIGNAVIKWSNDAAKYLSDAGSLNNDVVCALTNKSLSVLRHILSA